MVKCIESVRNNETELTPILTFLLWSGVWKLEWSCEVSTCEQSRFKELVTNDFSSLDKNFLAILESSAESSIMSMMYPNYLHQSVSLCTAQ